MGTFDNTIRDSNGWVHTTVFEPFDSSREVVNIEADIDTDKSSYCIFDYDFNDINPGAFYVDDSDDYITWPLNGFKVIDGSIFYTDIDAILYKRDDSNIQLVCMAQNFNKDGLTNDFTINVDNIGTFSIQSSYITKLSIVPRAYNVTIESNAIMCKNLEELWIYDKNIVLDSNFICEPVTTKLKNIYFDGNERQWERIINSNNVQIPAGVNVIFLQTSSGMKNIKVKIDGSLKTIVDAYVVKNDKTLGHIIDIIKK